MADNGPARTPRHGRIAGDGLFWTELLGRANAATGKAAQGRGAPRMSNDASPAGEPPAGFLSALRIVAGVALLAACAAIGIIVAFAI
jgi:hypothetical protein